MTRRRLTQHDGSASTFAAEPLPFQKKPGIPSRLVPQSEGGLKGRVDIRRSCISRTSRCIQRVWRGEGHQIQHECQYLTVTAAQDNFETKSGDWELQFIYGKQYQKLVLRRLGDFQRVNEVSMSIATHQALEHSK